MGPEGVFELLRGAAWHRHLSCGQPLVSVWHRTAPGVPLQILASTEAASAAPLAPLLFPPGCHGRPVEADAIGRDLSAFPSWVRLHLNADVLALDGPGPADGGLNLEQVLLSGWPGAFAVLLLAQPLPPEQIQAFLAGESPHTLALVIANMHTSLGAQVLAQLPSNVQADVAMRIATMTETSPDVIKDVEEVIRRKLAMVASQDYAAAGGVKGLADILNSADRGTERNVIDTLAEKDAQLAEEIKMLLFVFEDIVKLDDRSVQLVLKDVDQKDLAMALRGVSEEVKQKILGNMSQRGAEMLMEEMEYQPPQRRSVIEEAQTRIVGVVRRLEDAGAIVIARGDEDEEAEDLV